jgi:hypothetical protein
VPFLGWCGLRWAMVEHFGLVSFGGFNVIGITGQLLEQDTVERLSEAAQPLASEILERRNRIDDWKFKYSYSVFEENYNPMVWKIAVPATQKLYGDNSRKTNFELTRLSREVIRHRPVGYLIWLGLAAKHAIVQSIDLSIHNPMVVVALGAMILGHALGWWNRGRWNALEPLHPRRTHSLAYQTIVWLALGHAFCSLMLVILVEAPIARYCAPASLFMPSLICMLGADLWMDSVSGSFPNRKFNQPKPDGRHPLQEPS